MRKLTCNIRSETGISLMELMMAMAIASIGLLGSYTFFIGTQNTRAANVELIEAQQEARNILETIARDLRESSPGKVWLSPGVDGWSDYIAFHTPRNANREFVVDDDGQPVWQRGLGYVMDTGSNQFLRQHMTMAHDPDIYYDSYESEILSSNIERIGFKRKNDMIVISVRTYTNSDRELANVADSYIDLHTVVKLRN